MKATVTKALAPPATPTGPRLMRDKRDGQIILIDSDNRHIAVSKGEVSLGYVFLEPGIDASNLEPFHGSITLSNS